MWGVVAAAWRARAGVQCRAQIAFNHGHLRKHVGYEPTTNDAELKRSLVAVSLLSEPTSSP
jgi:hypothetical protein